VSIEEAKTYAEEAGIFHTETSAKTGDNVNELFLAIAHKLPKSEPKAEPGPKATVDLKTKNKDSKPQGGCC
jgi:Ras-related protein Rab-5C